MRKSKTYCWFFVLGQRELTMSHTLHNETLGQHKFSTNQQTVSTHKSCHKCTRRLGINAPCTPILYILGFPTKTSNPVKTRFVALRGKIPPLSPPPRTPRCVPGDILSRSVTLPVFHLMCFFALGLVQRLSSDNPGRNIQILIVCTVTVPEDKLGIRLRIRGGVSPCKVC